MAASVATWPKFSRSCASFSSISRLAVSLLLPRPDLIVCATEPTCFRSSVVPWIAAISAATSITMRRLPPEREQQEHAGRAHHARSPWVMVGVKFRPGARYLCGLGVGLGEVLVDAVEAHRRLAVGRREGDEPALRVEHGDARGPRRVRDHLRDLGGGRVRDRDEDVLAHHVELERAVLLVAVEVRVALAHRLDEGVHAVVVPEAELEPAAEM